MFQVKSIKHTTLAAAIALALSGAAFASGEHSHGSHPGEAKLTLNQGKKWQTDEALRKGMENIRSALAADLKAIHHDRLEPARYEALGKKVHGEVAYMIENCKLDKEADEQLHIVLVELIEGAEALEGKHAGEPRREGAERLVKALDAYGRYFDHPGWKRL